MKKILLLFLLGLSAEAFACSCAYMGPFVEMSKKTAIVAVIKVLKYASFSSGEHHIPLSMEVEVTEILKGKEARKNIIIWGDNGMLCRPYISTFTVGESYVMALGAAGMFRNEATTDYAVSGCGAYWLKFHPGMSTVAGDIDSKDKTITSVTLKNLLVLMSSPF